MTRWRLVTARSQHSLVRFYTLQPQAIYVQAYAAHSVSVYLCLRLLYLSDIQSRSQFS